MFLIGEKGDEMGKNINPISVWWDMNSCPVPAGFDPRLVGRNISWGLKNSGYVGPLTITAIGNLEHIPDEVLQPIHSTGIPLRHVLCEYQTDMVEYWRKEQPRCLMLISGLAQMEIFAPTLYSIGSLGFSILLAHPGREKGSEWLWNSFLLGVSKEWIWDSFLVQGSQKCQELSMDYGCVYDKPDGSGELSCKTCNRSWFRFEDFTKHIKSGEHIIHNVSDMVMSQPKPKSMVTMGTVASSLPFPLPPPIEYEATTTVFWDINTCPLPLGVESHLAGPRIKSALKNYGYPPRVNIFAICNLEHTDHLESLFSSGINLVNVSSNCVEQLFEWRRQSRTPSTLMLICGPTTLELLARSLFRIHDEGYTILVAHPGRTPRTEVLWKSFLSVVSREFIWKTFLEGSADDIVEALDSDCYVSCEMCNFCDDSPDYLTAHFSSVEHLEQLSYRARLPLEKHSSSTSTEGKEEGD
ncbi:hypothetical protein HA466_0198110 [Hirschfeldia incana]|nr:hypothetical protein HA466_0198110 [Hirschfeldia incana]